MPQLQKMDGVPLTAGMLERLAQKRIQKDEEADRIVREARRRRRKCTIVDYTPPDDSSAPDLDPVGCARAAEVELRRATLASRAQEARRLYGRKPYEAGAAPAPFSQPPAMTESERDNMHTEVRIMVLDGYPSKAISKATGMSQTTIFRWVEGMRLREEWRAARRRRRAEIQKAKAAGLP